MTQVGVHDGDDLSSCQAESINHRGAQPPVFFAGNQSYPGQGKPGHHVRRAVTAVVIHDEGVHGRQGSFPDGGQTAEQFRQVFRFLVGRDDHRYPNGRGEDVRCFLGQNLFLSRATHDYMILETL